MIVAGIDYSMTSPALCLHDTETEFNFENCDFHFLTQIKKYDDVPLENVHGHYFEYDGDMNRYDLISSFFIDRILDSGVVKVFIEDYSLVSKGTPSNHKRYFRMPVFSAILNTLPFEPNE